MLNLIQIEMVFIVAMGGLVVVQIVLQLHFHVTISCLSPQHRVILAEIGGCHHGGTGLRKHCSAGAKTSSKEDDTRHTSADPKKDLFVFGEKFLELIRCLLPNRFPGLCRCRAGRLRAGFPCCGIVFLYALLLIVAVHIAFLCLGSSLKSLLHLKLLIGSRRFMLQLGHLFIGRIDFGFLVMAVMPNNGLCDDFRTVRSFHTGVILLDLMDFSMHRKSKTVSNLTHSLFSFKGELTL